MKITSGKIVVLSIWSAFLLMLVYILLWLLGDQPARLRAEAYQGNTEAVQRLLDQHPGWINLPDKYGTTPLMEASGHLQMDTVKLLLSRGADVNATNYQGASVIHIIISQSGVPTDRQIAVLQVLIDKEANLNVRDQRGHTPLGKLEANSTNAVANWLREHGAKE